jgi:TolB-like protein
MRIGCSIERRPLTAGCFFLAAVLGGASAAAVDAADQADKIPIAVMEFSSKGGVEQAQMDALGDMLATELRAMGPYRVIGKHDISTMLQLEEQKNILGCDELGCISDIGGALGVRWVVVGNISRFGEVYLLNLKLMDVERVEVAKSVAHKVDGGQAALLDELGTAAAELLAGSELAAAGRAAEDTAAAAGQAQAGDGGDEAAGTVGGAAPAPASAMRTWGHVTFWSGLGLAALGGVGAGMASEAAGDYESGDLDGWDQSRTWSGVMWAGFGAGAALLITGAVLWALAPDEAPPAAVGVAPAAGGEGLVLGLGGSG